MQVLFTTFKIKNVQNNEINDLLKANIILQLNSKL